MPSLDPVIQTKSEVMDAINAVKDNLSEEDIVRLVRDLKGELDEILEERGLPC